MPNGGDEETFRCEEEPHMLSTAISGGYFPVQLGDIIKSDDSGIEYHIARKLGWGVTSTVWLAHYSDPYGQLNYTALKLLTCIASLCNSRDLSFENTLHMKLGAGSDQKPLGSEYCVVADELFITDSERGGHYCFSLPVMGPSIDQFHRDSAPRAENGQILPFSPDVTKNFGRQILLALDCIHSLGFIHADVKASNIFLNIGYHPDDVTDFLYESPSLNYEPRVIPALSPNPIITAQSQPLCLFDDFDPTTVRVCLGDFGEAVPVDQTAESDVAMHTALRAPEIILGHPWGTAIDVWGAGCVLFELLTGARLKMFNLDAPAGMTHTEVHLARMEELLGPFPQGFIERCNKSDQFFDANGRLLKPLANLPPCGSLRERLSQAGQAGAELGICEAFFRRCFQFDPDIRPSASEMVQDPWIASLTIS
ncbi:kinase-like domain-containing protein [Mycena galopus ATCC 62051]|nr:kinase-like domain-containing protein [Mycena galopus ATCC 62051]